MSACEHGVVATDINAELIAVSELVFSAIEGRRFEDLTEAERVIATVWRVEAEVNNGGFDQFFFNSSGDTVFYAEAALESIGAKKMAKIVARANAVFGADGPPRDRDLRQERLLALSESVSSKLNALDNEFYKYPDAVSTLLHDYITANAPELLARVRV